MGRHCAVNESRHFYVLGYDPGGTTGWAAVDVPSQAIWGDWSILDTMQFEVGQIGGPDATQARAIGQQLVVHNGPIVIEDFILRKFTRSRDLLAPVRMTARIEQMVEMLREFSPDKPELPIFKQQPSLAMTTCTDDRMRRWGIWTPGRPHANDALRHVVTFLRRCKGSRELYRAAFPD